MRYIESINQSLHRLFAEDERVHLLGEDLLDPYGGAFKVARGLSTAFPDRVLSTPISESAIVGAATGMAMRGLRPIVEIMFGDFLYLVADQVINHAAKFPWMYNGQVSVPLVIRTPVGGGRGYGPTHSQSPEGAFLGVPGLTILAPSLCHEPGRILSAAVSGDAGLCLMLEHKLLYPQELFPAPGGRHQDFQVRRLSPPGRPFETISLAIDPQAKPDLALICYGGMVPLALAVARALFMEEEWRIEVVVPACIRPVPLEDLLPAAIRAGRVLVLEEGNPTAGWGAEVSALLHEHAFKYLAVPVQRLASLDCPIPSALSMEKSVLPSVETLSARLRALLA